MKQIFMLITSQVIVETENVVFIRITAVIRMNELYTSILSAQIEVYIYVITF